MSKGSRGKQTQTERSVLIRIRLQDHGSLGPGKVRLLEKIDEVGSISAAARTMNMSYRRAWLHIDSLNRCFGRPVILGSQGGAHGGGAELTELGRDLIHIFREMEVKAEQALSSELDELYRRIGKKSRSRQ